MYLTTGTRSRISNSAVAPSGFSLKLLLFLKLIGLTRNSMKNKYFKYKVISGIVHCHHSFLRCDRVLRLLELEDTLLLPDPTLRISSLIFFLVGRKLWSVGYTSWFCRLLLPSLNIRSFLVLYALYNTKQEVTHARYIY